MVSAENEPRALETLTTTGLSDFRRSGSAAFVTRMTPTALVFDRPRADLRELRDALNTLYPIGIRWQDLDQDAGGPSRAALLDSVLTTRVPHTNAA